MRGKRKRTRMTRRNMPCIRGVRQGRLHREHHHHHQQRHLEFLAANKERGTKTRGNCLCRLTSFGCLRNLALLALVLFEIVAISDGPPSVLYFYYSVFLSQHICKYTHTHMALIVCEMAGQPEWCGATQAAVRRRASERKEKKAARENENIAVSTSFFSSFSSSVSGRCCCCWWFWQALCSSLVFFLMLSLFPWINAYVVSTGWKSSLAVHPRISMHLSAQPFFVSLSFPPPLLRTMKIDTRN